MILQRKTSLLETLHELHETLSKLEKAVEERVGRFSALVQTRLTGYSCSVLGHHQGERFAHSQSSSGQRH